jgi:rare lipoprotein A
MATRRALSLALIVSAALAASTCTASAQSFDERWSVVPQAKADEPTHPPTQRSVLTPEENNHSAGLNALARFGSRSPQARSRQTRSTRGASSTKFFTGKASYISYTGGKTASGAPYRPQAFTAAHRTLPFGTRLEVTDVRSGKHVQVTVTDRGPFVRGRVLDLSRGAAQALGMKGRGVIQVRTEVLPENGGRAFAKGS